MMETPDGEKRTLTNGEIAVVIKKLQDENRCLNERLRDGDIPLSKTFHHSNNAEPENKVFIFTDADENMDVIESKDVNEYVTKQIQEIRDLREKLNQHTQCTQNNQHTQISDLDNTKNVIDTQANALPELDETLKSFKKEMISEVKKTIIAAMYGDEDEQYSEVENETRLDKTTSSVEDDSPIKVSIKVK